VIGRIRKAKAKEDSVSGIEGAGFPSGDPARWIDRVPRRKSNLGHVGLPETHEARLAPVSATADKECSQVLAERGRHPAETLTKKRNPEVATPRDFSSTRLPGAPCTRRTCASKCGFSGRGCSRFCREGPPCRAWAAVFLWPP